MDFGPTGKRGENGRKMGKLPFLPIFGPIFPFFDHFYPFSPVGPKSIFRQFFSLFGPEARFGVCTATGQPRSQNQWHLRLCNSHSTGQIVVLLSLVKGTLFSRNMGFQILQASELQGLGPSRECPLSRFCLYPTQKKAAKYLQ